MSSKLYKIVMPNYCALEDAFPVPEWVEQPSSYKETETNHNDQRYGTCNIPQEWFSSITDGVSSRDNQSLYNQDEYSLYKVLQNKYGSIPLYQAAAQSTNDKSQTQTNKTNDKEGFSEGFLSMPSFSGFAANDFDRLLIILLAGFLLLTIIDYGKK